MHARIALVLLLAACSVAACSARDARVAESAQGLKIASWNLEHLAEQDGLGCRPRTESDYAALRAYAKRLDADVVAFQEVESAAAAARVFPSAEYSVVISTRPPSGRQHFCGRDATDGPLIREQKVGFAIRHGVEFKRNADFAALGLDNADLRWGVDITLQGEHPLRLLAVHLKSGCSAGSDREACPVLFEQVPVLDQWIEEREGEGE
ncbi:MAG: endonuclease/exonuclease/phosphatase, partial [Gammaproteobacteria bacterium]